jgi:predicted transcriptional regulator
MTAKKTESEERINRFIVGGKLSEKEFKEGIKSAEKGKFTTVQESMTAFDEWLKKRTKEM